MSNKARNTSGKFAAKSETPRKVRSVNLTDDAWQWLADVAARAGVSRNDYIEAMAEGSVPIMETVNSETSPIIETVESDKVEIPEQQQDNVLPLMETVGHALTTKEEALAHAKIYGFTPEEALADAHFQISMLQANNDELEDRYDKLRSSLERGDTLINLRNQEIAALNSRLAAKEGTIADMGEQIDKLEAELADLKQKSATAEKEFPDMAEVYNQFKAENPKAKITYKDAVAILATAQAMMEES